LHRFEAVKMAGDNRLCIPNATLSTRRSFVVSQKRANLDTGVSSSSLDESDTRFFYWRKLIMMDALQIISLLLVVLAMVPALAHALELPGKLRLTKETYVGVQRIYYPGFTIVGFSEPVAIISTAVLLILTPRGTTEFWLTLVALLGVIGMHAAYWLFTHPVNNFWLQDEKLSGAGSRFFAMGSQKQGAAQADWTDLRDRWEYSHVARAGLALISFLALLTAIAWR
jgi:hypothetical protein